MDTVVGRYVHPMIIPFYQELPVRVERRVGIVSLSQGVAKPQGVRHWDRAEICIRLGSVVRPTTREQRARLRAIGGLLRAKQLPVSGGRFTDLGMDRPNTGFTGIIGEEDLRRASTHHGEWVRRPFNLGFVAEPEGATAVCAIAGLVLSGHDPRRHLPYAGIRWMAFEGPDKEYRAQDDRVPDGPTAPLHAAC